MKPFFAALRFLTILPVPEGWCGDGEDLGRSVPAFPVIGLLIGFGAALLARGLQTVCPPPVLAAGITILLAAVSCGLHLDGLSDTADGFLSSRPRARVLEILKDSHIGAMGVIAIVSVFALKIAALASLRDERLLQAVFLMPLAGRCATVGLMSLLAYVRPEGLGSLFARHRSIFHAWWAAAVLFAAGWLLAGWAGVAAGGAVVLLLHLFAWLCWRRIGGYTGDTLGAVCELAECVPALVLAAG